MDQIELPKIGDLVFEQSWNDIVCRAVVVEVDGVEAYVEVRMLTGGAVVWSSPKVQSNDEEMAFGQWCDGSGLPSWFGDLDGDGRPELLAAVPKADLTPTEFRIFVWDGQQLSLQRTAALVRDEAGRFVWTEVDPEHDGPLAWVDAFDDGSAQIVHRRRATTTHRSLQLVPSTNGFIEAP